VLGLRHFTLTMCSWYSAPSTWIAVMYTMLHEPALRRPRTGTRARHRDLTLGLLLARVPDTLRSMPRRKPKGVFCLEGSWFGSADRSSVEPVLALLERLDGVHVPYVRRDAITREEFFRYIDIWRQSGLRRYPVLYLGFHGERGQLVVGDGRHRKSKVSLDALEEALEDKAYGRLIHFGSCSTLALHGRRLNRFLARTGALAVMGYRGEIQWVESMAFELLLLGMLQKCSMTRSGMRRLDGLIKKEARQLARRLNFRLQIRR
jgi:hypothetical protein